jgi:UDP-glucose 4-epimerase
MSKILITGASGFIGGALARSMAASHDIVCLSRRRPDGVDVPYVRGKFHSFEDLQQLNPYQFEVLVHLGAVTGGCLESDCLMVNVEGTRRLMRYLIDRGCRKFVMASSIAAVGIQSPAFRPLQVPIPDEHPCLDRDGYGISKYLMEEVTKYYQRQVEEIDVIDLRLASVSPDERMSPLKRVGPLGQWCLAGITQMALSDTLRAFTLAVEASYQPGVRIMNAVGPKAWVADPVADILRNWWGDDVDVSYFEQVGCEYSSVYSTTRIRTELGFVANVLPRRD